LQQFTHILSPFDSHHHQYLQVINYQYNHVSYHSQLPISSSMIIHFHRSTSIIIITTGDGFFYLQQFPHIPSPFDSYHHQYLQVLNNQYYHVSLSFSTTNITIYDHTLSQVNINTYYYYGGCVFYLQQFTHIAIIISIYRLSTISIIMYLYHSQLPISSSMNIQFTGQHQSSLLLRVMVFLLEIIRTTQVGGIT